MFKEVMTMPEHPTHRATARTQVKTFVPTTFDELEGGPALVEIHLTETFTGDIEGDGTGRALQAARDDGSATFVGLERVRGSIAGRKGTFLLRVSGTIAHREMHAEWFVVPRSGTGELARLRGDGGFEAQLGQHGSVWLDYFFE
jgi:hypothetical protein